MHEFVDVLKDEEVAVYKTFSAREKYDKDGSGKTLAENIGEDAKYFNDKKQLINYVHTKIKDDYAVIFLGAGDIDRIMPQCLNATMP